MRTRHLDNPSVGKERQVPSRLRGRLTSGRQRVQYISAPKRLWSLLINSVGACGRAFTAASYSTSRSLLAGASPQAAGRSLLTVMSPFKYVVTCVIQQKNGAGMNTAATCFWDTNKDGYAKVMWDNATMHCIVTVYGICINIESNTDLD